MRVFDRIEAWGHPNVTAKNLTTFELTKENYLTKRGDCILAINASKGARDLNEEFKKLARREDAKITVILEAASFREMSKGRGDPQLTLSHPTDLVVRKSTYICDRTLMICSDKVAKDFPRAMIEALQNPLQKVIATLIVDV